MVPPAALAVFHAGKHISSADSLISNYAGGNMKLFHFGNHNPKILSAGQCALIIVILCGFVHAQTICGTQPFTSVNNNTFHVQNNEFNSSANECINVNGTIFNVAQSAINNAANGGPGAFPSIYIGCHWGSCTSNSNLPIQVSSITTARSNWNTSQPTSGTYDAAYDIWFNTTPTTSGQPDGAEVMIWLDYRGTIQPFGSQIANGVNIGGAS